MIRRILLSLLFASLLMRICDAASWTLLSNSEVPQNSSALRLAPDGNSVVGVTSNNVLFRWTRGGSFAVSSSIPDIGRLLTPEQISQDGTTVVGRIEDLSDAGVPSAGGKETFRWSLADGFINIGHPKGRYYRPEDWTLVSRDGSVITGRYQDPFTLQYHSFVWTTDRGLTSSPIAFVKEVSADGRTLVGSASFEGPPVLWTELTGAQSLNLTPYLPITPNHVTTGLSPDGRVLFGRSDLASFRWSESGGYQRLGQLGYSNNSPTDASANGELIVGHFTDELSYALRTFIWAAKLGMQPLHEVLAARGVSMDVAEGNFNLDVPVDISDDGNVILGYSRRYHPEGPQLFTSAYWIADLSVPEPATLSAAVLGLMSLFAMGRGRIWRR